MTIFTSQIRKAVLFGLLLGCLSLFGSASCDVSYMLNVLDQTGQDIVGGVAVDATGDVYWVSATDEITKQPLSGDPVSYTYTPTSIGLGGFPLVVGPDGNIWCANNDNEIVKMTTAGVFSVYSASGQIVSLTNGPDGNLWFVDQGTGKIGKITTSGTITEYTVTNTPTGIVTGDDGLLYAAEVDGSFHTRLKSYNTSGTLQANSDLGAFLPGQIYKDSEGNFWIQNASANNNFIKSTPAGAGTSLTLPIDGSGSNQIGQLLFTDGGFFVTGNYGDNDGAISLARVDNLNQLIGVARYSPETMQTDYIAQSPVNQYIYTVNANGSPTVLTTVEEILDVQLRETDKAKKDQY